MLKRWLPLLIFGLFSADKLFSAPSENVSEFTQSNHIVHLSLEELLNLKVSSVSKLDESVLAAPGIVTVITANQIKELGANNIHEVLMATPGTFYSANYFSLTGQISIRGNLSSGGNNKTLFLVNGHPFFHAVDGIYFPDLIAVETIERIEVIRGPVSVMYGTNALNGVISIITKNNTDGKNIDAELSISSFDTLEGLVNAQKRWQDGKFYFSAKMQNQDGYNMYITPEQDMLLNTTGSTRQFEEYTKIYSHLKQGNFESNFIYFNQDKTAKYGILPTLLFKNIGPFENEVLGIDLKYDWQISDSTNLKAMLRFDSTSFTYSVDNYQILQNAPDATKRIGTGSWDGDKTGFEIYSQTSFQHGHWVNGFVIDKYFGDPVLFETGVSEPFILIPKSTDNQDYSFYSNGQYNLEQHTLIGGIRITDNETSGTNLDYRMGWIWTLNENLSFKTLYGTAYRSPHMDELYQDAPPVVLGNTNLDYERLKGFDFNLNYQSEKMLLTVGYFKNETEDEIRTYPDENGIPTFNNGHGYAADGVEFDLSYFPVSDLKLYLRGSQLLSYKSNLDSRSIKNSTISKMIAMGLNYNLNNIQFNLNHIYNSKWLNSSSYQLINGNIRYQWTENKMDMEIYLRAHNLLDEDYTYAEWQGTSVDTLPGGAGRSIELGYKISW